LNGRSTSGLLHLWLWMVKTWVIYF